jgi:hypothetical protein
MNRYETSMPRTSLGIAAIALAVCTFALTVMLPAHLYSTRIQNESRALAKHAAPQPIEVAIIPSRIDVRGPCDQAMAYEPARRVHTVDRDS